jgi:hypothetical protein
MHTKSKLAGLGLALAIAGCASGGGTSSSAGSGGGSPAQVSRSPNVITADELAGEAASNAYDTIDHLRPSMLTARPSGASGGGGGGRGGRTGGGSTSGPNVYLDTKRLGDVTTLKGVAVNTLKEIRFYNSSDAEQRFGPGNPSGVIALISR